MKEILSVEKKGNANKEGLQKHSEFIKSKFEELSSMARANGVAFGAMLTLIVDVSIHRVINNINNEPNSDLFETGIKGGIVVLLFLRDIFGNHGQKLNALKEKSAEDIINDAAKMNKLD